MKQGQEKYYDLFENARDVIFILDRDGKFLEVNQAFLREGNWFREEVIGQNFSLLVHPDDMETALAIYQKNLTGQHLEFEMPARKKDGSFSWYSFINRPLTDSEGNVTGITSIARNIDERRRVEEQLRFQGRILNQIADLVTVTDLEGKVTYINDAVCQTLGRSREDLLGRHVSTFGEDPATGATQAEMLRQVLQDGFWRGEVTNHRPDGRSAILDCRLQVITDEAGNPLALGGISTDITERKQSEEALRQSEKRLRTILETSPDPIIVYDQQGHPQYLNPAFTRVFGWHIEEVRGRVIPFVPEDQKELTRNKIREIYETGGIQHLETKRLTKEGRTIEVLISAALLKETDEAPSGLVVCLADISKTKELQEQIRQAHKTEAVSTLAGGIAHEFNNMLAIILGNTELAAESITPEDPAAECLDEIQMASQRARDVVRKLQSISHQPLTNRRPLCIASFLEESLQKIKAALPPTITLHANILCHEETVLAVPEEARQILTNLCDNAVDAMAKERGELTVDLKPVVFDAQNPPPTNLLAGDTYVKLTVADTGKGFKPEIKDRLYDPYFTTKEVEGRLGMGLAVVKGLVTKHGGVVTINNHPGSGTRAEVLLPAIGTEASAKPQKSRLPFAGSECILFVDDEEPLVKMITRILQNHGYTVVGKTSSLEALKTFQANPDQFGLLITDMIMPQMSGDQLAKKVLSICPGLPVIFCSGHSESIDQEAAKSLGIRYYLQKPFDTKAVVDTIREILASAEIKDRRKP